MRYVFGNRERQAVPAILPFPVIPPDGPNAEREDELDRGAAILLLVEMVERWGVETVHGWTVRIGDSQGAVTCRPKEQP